jgi:hypothetical protein
MERDFKAEYHSMVERAQAMPKQGASSGFKYGRAVARSKQQFGVVDMKRNPLRHSDFCNRAASWADGRYKKPLCRKGFSFS